MKAAVLILISIAGIAYNIRGFRKALLGIQLKNKTEPEAWKRVANYPTTVIWYAYLFVFFVGLTVNNLIFTD